MVSVPFKRVGAPASFKGVRGAYLNKFILKAGIAFFLVILVMPFSLPWMIRSSGLYPVLVTSTSSI